MFSNKSLWGKDEAIAFLKIACLVVLFAVALMSQRIEQEFFSTTVTYKVIVVEKVRRFDALDVRKPDGTIGAKTVPLTQFYAVKVGDKITQTDIVGNISGYTYTDIWTQ